MKYIILITFTFNSVFAQLSLYNGFWKSYYKDQFTFKYIYIGSESFVKVGTGKTINGEDILLDSCNVDKYNKVALKKGVLECFGYYPNEERKFHIKNYEIKLENELLYLREIRDTAILTQVEIRKMKLIPFTEFKLYKKHIGLAVDKSSYKKPNFTEKIEKSKMKKIEYSGCSNFTYYLYQMAPCYYLDTNFIDNGYSYFLPNYFDLKEMSYSLGDNHYTVRHDCNLEKVSLSFNISYVFDNNDIEEVIANSKVRIYNGYTLYDALKPNWANKLFTYYIYNNKYILYYLKTTDKYNELLDKCLVSFKLN